MNGGYLMVSKSDTNLYIKLNNALTVGKPILWYEDENNCYYIDTITKSGTDIVLTKGGKTITIESDGDITEVGNIQPSELKPIYFHKATISHMPTYTQCNFWYYDNKENAVSSYDELKALITERGSGITIGEMTTNHPGGPFGGPLYLKVYLDNIRIYGKQIDNGAFFSTDQYQELSSTDFSIQNAINIKLN